jgi:nucleoside-diphosphate-sugar epimerase
VKILVTGATGYVGNAVARAFRRAGHDVLGLTRSAEKERLLARAEIRPVRGDITAPETFRRVAESCSVLVHAAADLEKGMVEPDRAALDVLLDAARRGPRPKTLAYTSGVWVHGDTGPEAADETTPLSPARKVAWRPAHEERVLCAPGVRGLVIRPGCLYGGPGGLTAGWFGDARAGSVQIIGDGSNHWAMVHADDLGDAYVRAVESDVAGQVFDVVDHSRHTVLELALAAARAAGGSGVVTRVPIEAARARMGDYADCLALDQHVDAGKALRLLAWRPRHRGFVAEAEALFAAWSAHQAG